jgi:tRNA(Ile)-lysidine synthase
MIRSHPSIVLAVSGGLDSTCLAHMARACQEAGARLRVATFDHRSGPHAARAVEHVKAMAAQLGLPVDVGRSTRTARSESAWRADRWHFLLGVAAEHEAVVATAHTLDDHLETVVMRILRGAGARGLAGLLADTTAIVRPLVYVPRAELANYAERHGLTWIDDPTNESRRFFRNRVRLDLLPALRRADPSLPGELLRLSTEAAALRRGMERLVAPWVSRQGSRLLVSDEVLRLSDVTARSAA